MKGNTGSTLLGLLERRLDNVVHKLGFSASRPAARQAVSHGHVYVNGRRVGVPSYLVRVGDRVSLKDADRSRKLVRASIEELGEPQLQNWLQLDLTKFVADVTAMPTRDDVTIPVEEQLIVELCSQ
jgi:small subunit ribosomal protein S4